MFEFDVEGEGIVRTLENSGGRHLEETSGRYAVLRRQCDVMRCDVGFCWWR